MICSSKFWSLFFEVEDKAVSVTTAHYVQMLQNFSKTMPQDVGEKTLGLCQRDDATDYIAKKINQCFARTLQHI